MKIRVIACVFLVLAAIGWAWAQAPAEVNISLDTSGSTPVVTVSPATVTVDKGGKVRWLSSGDHNARVKIEFAEASGRRGPFPADGHARGRYDKHVGSPILTLGADTSGNWKYDVVWETVDGQSYRLDPFIVVR